MFFVIWRGRGYLVLIAIIVSFLLADILASAFGFSSGTPQKGVMEFLVATVFSIPLWIYGKRWNAPLELINKKTGGEITVNNPHTFFWIPMQYWAMICPVLLILVSASG